MTFELPVLFTLLFLEDRDERKDRFKSYAGEVGENGDALGPDDRRCQVKTTLGMFQVELV